MTSGERIPRVDVLGVGVSAVNLDMATQTIGEWIASGASEYICVRDVHGVVASLKDPELQRIHADSGMVAPDGMPLVWCGRFAGATWIDRVYGPDLLLRVCETSVEHGWSHFFYGAGPGVADELAGRLASRFPGLKVAGAYSPPFRSLTDEETVDTVRMLNDSGAHIVWVGLSSPKQERWMSDLRPLLAAPVLIGVGAAFDMHSGRVKQAPRWIQRSGFEWLFRIAMEPRRLWRRYAAAIPQFMVRIALNRPRLVEGSPTDGEHPIA